MSKNSPIWWVFFAIVIILIFVMAVAGTRNKQMVIREGTKACTQKGLEYIDILSSSSKGISTAMCAEDEDIKLIKFNHKKYIIING